MEYFTSEKISKHITRIKDICDTFFYLVEGEDKACLLDTGDGYGDIKEYVSRLTDKDLFVILTHGHLDHVGGVSCFDEVYMSHKDKDIYQKHAQLEYRKEHNKQNPLCEHTPEELLTPYVNCDDFHDLTDGEIFDLGNVHIQMIAVPGHTPGMFCALIQEDRYCLFGDACGVFVLLFDDYSSCVSEYLQSLKHLKEFENDYDHIIRNHGTGKSEKDLLDNVIECCQLILSGKDDHIPIEFMGESLFMAKKNKENGQGREDGKEGNIAYRKDKAK